LTKKILTALLLVGAIPIAIGLTMALTKEEDNVPPEVQGVDTGVYNETVSPTFNEGTALLNGEGFTSGTAISADGTYVLEVTDDNGNATSKEFAIDQTAPGKPAVEEVDDQTDTIAGSAEADSKVKVWSDDELLAAGNTDADGSFRLPIAPQSAGSTVFIAAIDLAGNQSDRTAAEVRDVTAPNAPEVDAVTDKTATISGNAETGAAIQVYAGDDKLGETASNVNGIFVLKISQQASGTELAVLAIDAAGNRSEAQTVKVTSSGPASNPNGENQPAIETTYINDILVVNKKYALPPSYAPGINPTAQSALDGMIADAGKAGHELNVISSYRSYSYQEDLYNRYVSSHGEEQAKRFAALPGHSEHQTGLTFDLGGTENEGDWLSGSFGDTPAGKWLAANAHQYGFIVRYPKGKEAITGYIYEPWHFRYLGVEAATKVYHSGLTLEEYLGISGG